MGTSKNTIEDGITIFDCYGNLLKEIKEDEKTFKIKLEYLPGEDSMGYKSFKIFGPKKNINKFLSHYDLQLDSEAQKEYQKYFSAR